MFTRANTSCDRQSDRQGKTICLLTLKWGDIMEMGRSSWEIPFCLNGFTLHHAHLPVAVASRLTCDLGVTAWGSTSGSCSFC